MQNTVNKPKRASLVEVGDMVKFDNLGWRKVIEVDADWMKNGGWVYFTIEGHPEESRRSHKCSIRHDIEMPWRRS